MILEKYCMKAGCLKKASLTNINEIINDYYQMAMDAGAIGW